MFHTLHQGDVMNQNCCDPLALTTAINSLAVCMARSLNDDELVFWAAVLTQLGDTLGTIAAQRELCGGS
ncbi:hypothetical protein SDC9_109078 [bioreactor metagenome]|uniref:DUF6774 domain-containing protein n=2 Tax=root TaxID=1 RepID=A0A645B9V4_9ZZZZ|nr:DUF6774 domain-containing protein [Oscillibacter sp.]MEA4992620.1 DUF6774 domain-containing protein [Oscillibacter sp.]